MNSRLSFLTLCLISFALSASAQKLPDYKNKNLPVDKRVADLIQRMTLEEKVLQLNQWAYGRNTNVNNIEEKRRAVRPEIGSLIFQSVNPVFRNQVQKKAMEESRLGIPMLIGFDIIHGCRTVYPIPLAQACSWNPDLATKASAMAAKESKLSGIDWTFSPMVDVARDPRWGRVAEGYGEDPYLTSVFSVAAVKGYQGKSLSNKYSVAACLKHYIGYSLSEGGRDYHSSDVSPQTLWETFMPPFEAGVKAGAATLMSGFNDISGIPASANPYTLTEVLKKRWKHEGFVVSDWGSVANLIPQGFAADKKEAAYKAFMSGVEMDMVDNLYTDYLGELVKEKKVPMAKIDDAVSRVLKLKFQLGLFEKPYVEELPESERYFKPEDIAIAAKMAEESMVLLKNTNKTLPLKNSIKQIALIGPMVKDTLNMLGSWAEHGLPSTVETIYTGVQKEFKDKAGINYAFGCGFEGTDESGFEAAIEAAKKSDVIIACMGEMKKWSGENASRSTIALPGIQERLIAALKKTGKPIVLVLSSGRPVELQRLEPQVDAILEIWQPGVAGGTPVAQILSGTVNPSGKLAITFPLTTGQIPVYYNSRQSARPTLGKYQDIGNKPMYWFGHGLSYTDFTYGDVKLSSTKIKKNQKLVAQVEVANTGAMDGKETVLWYLSDPSASITRPFKELKHFEKRELKAGEKAVYTFEIDPMRDLSFPDSDGKRRLESGDFYLSVNNQKLKFELVD